MVEDIVYTKLLENSTLSSAVRGNIYPSVISSVKSIEYPFVAFQSQGGPKDMDFPYSKMVIQFWVVSRKSYRDAVIIYNYIESILDHQLFDDDDVYVVFHKDGEPTRYFDPEGEGLYYTTGTYTAYKIDK